MLERVWRKGNPLTLLVGMQTSTAIMENSVEISLKTGKVRSYRSTEAGSSSGLCAVSVLFLTQGEKVSPKGLAMMTNGKYGKFCTTSAVSTMKFIGQKVKAYDSVVEFIKYS